MHDDIYLAGRIYLNDAPVSMPVLWQFDDAHFLMITLCKSRRPNLLTPGVLKHNHKLGGANK